MLRGGDANFTFGGGGCAAPAVRSQAGAAAPVRRLDSVQQAADEAKQQDDEDRARYHPDPLEPAMEDLSHEPARQIANSTDEAGPTRQLTIWYSGRGQPDAYGVEHTLWRGAATMRMPSPSSVPPNTASRPYLETRAAREPVVTGSTVSYRPPARICNLALLLDSRLPLATNVGVCLRLSSFS